MTFCALGESLFLQLEDGLINECVFFSHVGLCFWQGIFVLHYTYLEMALDF